MNGGITTAMHVDRGASVGTVPSYDYSAFGLAIRSQIILPELSRAQFDEPDVQIRLEPARHGFPSPDTAGQFIFGETRCSMLWPRIGAFTIDESATITVEPAPGATADLIAFPLLGPVFAVLMQMRGALVLHGSALNVRGSGLCFLGDKGAGKSTTAAALTTAGHRLLTDDVLVIQPIDGKPHILPTFAQLKLSDAASRVLGFDRRQRRRPVREIVQKHRYRIGSAFAQQPTILKHLFLLKRSDRLHLRPLDAPVRFKALLRFTYVSRFGAGAMSSKAAITHAGHCSQVANGCKVSILEVPDDLGALDDLVALVEREADCDDDP